MGAALSGCDASSGSEGSSGPSAGSSGRSDATSVPSGTTDPQSRALCSAVTNAVGSGTDWVFDPPVPASREVGGVAVPACEAVADAGTHFTAAYLANAGGLTGADLLSALCQAVVHAKTSAGARSCSAPKRGGVTAGTEVRRADLATGDGGVLVLSFGSNRPEYLDSAVADLGTVGKALAADPLLARAVG